MSDLLSNLMSPDFTQSAASIFGGMSGGFAQAAMPSRMPIPFGAALGMAGAGVAQGMKTARELQQQEAQTQLTRQQTAHAGLENQLAASGLPVSIAQNRMLADLWNHPDQIKALMEDEPSPFGAPQVGPTVAPQPITGSQTVPGPVVAPQGGQGGGAPQAPIGATPPIPQAPSGGAINVPQVVSQSARTLGVDPLHALTVAQIESGMGGPDDPGNSNTGVFQLGPNERARWGVTDPTSVGQQITGGIRALAHEQQTANAAVGGQAEPWQAYIVHQQGDDEGGGGWTLLRADPNADAAQTLVNGTKEWREKGYGAALQGLRNNIPSDMRAKIGPNPTVGQFLGAWKDRYSSIRSRFEGGASGGQQASTAAPQPGAPAPVQVAANGPFAPGAPAPQQAPVATSVGPPGAAIAPQEPAGPVTAALMPLGVGLPKDTTLDQALSSPGAALRTSLWYDSKANRIELARQLHLPVAGDPQMIRQTAQAWLALSQAGPKALAEARAKAQVELQTAGPIQAAKSAYSNVEFRPGGMARIIDANGNATLVKNPELREVVDANGSKTYVHINPASPYDAPGTPGQAAPVLSSNGTPAVAAIAPQQQLARDKATEEFVGKDQDSYVAAQNTQAWISQITNAADTMAKAGPAYMTGDFAPQRLSAMSHVNDIARSLGITPPFDQGAVASWEEMKKATTTAGFELASHYEGHARQAAQTITNATSAVPAEKNSPEGLALVSAGIREAAQSAMDVHEYKQSIYNRSQGAGLESAETDFYRAHPAYQYANRAISTVHPFAIISPEEFSRFLPGTFVTVPKVDPATGKPKVVQVPERPGAPPIPAYLQRGASNAP